MSEGRLTIDRAMATRCIWPPDSSLGLCLMRSLRPTRSMSSMARCLPAAPFFTYRSGSITFSSTFMPESRLYSWKTKPTLRARIFARWRSPSLVVSTSSMKRLPAVGFNSSPRRSSMVVLPLPDRPTTATNSPLSMSSVTPSRARMISLPRLYCLRRSSRRTSAITRSSKQLPGPAWPRGKQAGSRPALPAQWRSPTQRA